MTGDGTKIRAGLWPGLIALSLTTAYVIALLAAEKQAFIILLLAIGIAAVVAAAWFGLFNGVSRSFADNEDAMGSLPSARRSRSLHIFTRIILPFYWSSPCCFIAWRHSA